MSLQKKENFVCEKEFWVRLERAKLDWVSCIQLHLIHSAVVGMQLPLSYSCSLNHHFLNNFSSVGDDNEEGYVWELIKMHYIVGWTWKCIASKFYFLQKLNFTTKRSWSVAQSRKWSVAIATISLMCICLFSKWDSMRLYASYSFINFTAS